MSRSLLTTASLLLATIVCIGLACGAGNPAGDVAFAGTVGRKAAGKIAGAAQLAPFAPISLSDSDGQELTLEELSIRTAINGMLSLTEVELRFRNPKARRMEGRFTCTLPATAAISRFAKEVNGTLMEGEVVERLRANQVYEQFLHQMRDPALLEQDQGNRFSARIFPIDPNASVRILLSYSQLLPMHDGTRTYAFPLRGLPKVGKLTFRGFVTPLQGEEDAGRIAGATHSTADMYSINERDYTPDRDVEIAFHATASAPGAQTIRAGDFYLASFRPEVRLAKIAPPHDWLFFVDTSASAADSQTLRIRALEQVIASLPESDRIRIVAFDQEFANVTTPADLKDRLFLGGTDIAALLRRVASEARGHPSRAIVIASDFVPTLGTVDKKELTDLANAIPHGAIVDALILGPREDASLAKTVVAGRGRVVSVSFSESLDVTARNAAQALQRPAGASFDVADSNAEWVYPQHVEDVQPGDEVIVAGKLRVATEPHVTLGGMTAPSTSSLDAQTFAPLLEREAYREYLDYLAIREASEPSEAVRSALASEQVKISTEQRVVIPRTTMLVLESEWDYQRFGLDRRALAAILTIGAGGIERLDRHTNAPARILVGKIPPPPPRPVSVRTMDFVQAPASAAAQSDAPSLREAAKVERGVEGGVEGGVVGGVAGGVVGGVVRTNAAPMAPPPIVARPVDAAHRRERDQPRADAEWAAAVRPSKERVEELEAKVRNDPRDRELYNQLSEALAARGEWSALRRLAIAWQEYDAENPQVYEILGQSDEHLGNENEAARADASLIEIAPGKTELLQRAAMLLVRAHRAPLAEAPLRRALELRPDRANGYRHLALMLWLDGRTEEAARVLESATHQQFPNWYGNVQRVLHEELGYVYRAWIAKEPSRRSEIEALAHEYDVDLSRRDALRVTLAWETDANDVDLHLIDPSGAECYYGHKQNPSGIELYEDITQGLGPEVIRGSKIERGVYRVGVRYFAAGPMGVSRGIVVIIRDDRRGDGQRQPSIEIVPFRLVEGGGDIRHIADVSM
ncbi:MAG TPA: VIT domain-containing protein [Thermoanaerobaculia bacterium]